MAESRRFPIAAMVAFTRDALLACGVPDADADLAARQMIEADLTGFDAHGIVRLGNYLAWIKSGRVNAKANIKVLQRSPATALVDGDDGIGRGQSRGRERVARKRDQRGDRITMGVRHACYAATARARTGK